MEPSVAPRRRDASWVRVPAAATGEIVWETVISARTVESVAVLQQAIQGAEVLLGLQGDDQETLHKRARAGIRLIAAGAAKPMLTWLLSRGYQVTGKFKSSGRVRKLVQGITQWQATSSPGREVAPFPEPVEFVHPLSQYAVRTPSKEYAGGYYHAVVFTSRTDLTMNQVVEHYDGRAGIEADLKSDKQGLGLATIRKQRLPAQMIVVLLMQLAHNVLVWARHWLSEAAPRLHDYGILRLIEQVWAIPGRLKPSTSRSSAFVSDPNTPEHGTCAEAFAPCFSNIIWMSLCAKVKAWGFWAKSWLWSSWQPRLRRRAMADQRAEGLVAAAALASRVSLERIGEGLKPLTISQTPSENSNNATGTADNAAKGACSPRRPNITAR